MTLKQKLALRFGALTVFVLFATLTFGPVVVMAADGGTVAAPAKVATQPAKVAPAPAATAPATAPTAPAAAPSAAPTAEPAAAVKVDKKDEAKTQSWWQAMLVPVLGIVGLFISAFLAGGLLKLVKLIEKKWNIDIPDSIEQLMADKAKWAVAWAEEKAETRLLYGDGQKTPGAEKLSAAVDMVMKFADERGYGDAWRREKVEDLVTGVLHLERGVGVGSDGARGAKLTEKTNGTPA